MNWDFVGLDLAAWVTLPAGIILAVLVGLWAKQGLSDSRWVPWVILGVVEAVMIGVRVILSGGGPSAAEIAITALLAFVACSIETFGYETIQNSLGIAGIGSRSDAEEIEKAIVVTGRVELQE